MFIVNNELQSTVADALQVLRIITLPSSCELNNEFILLQHTYGVDLVDRVDRQDGLDPMPAQIATTPHLTV